MGNTVACLVACGSSKRDGSNPSWGLYSSTLFEKSWAAASLVGQPFVMSAKHGLLTVDDRITPYNETLKNYSAEEKQAWAHEVASSLPDKYDTVVLFGGRDYVDPLIEAFNNIEVIDPYQNTSGNGRQMSVAGDIIEMELNGDEYL